MGNRRVGSQKAFVIRAALLALGLGGCGFGGGGSGAETDGDTEDTEGTTGTDSGPSTNTSPTAPSTSPPTATEPTTGEPTATAEDTTDPDTMGSEESSDADTNASCDPFAVLQWAQDLPERDRTLGQRVATFLPQLDGEPVDFLHGEQEQQGFAEFRFDIPCGDNVTLWALAWDAEAGTVDNADSFFFTLDEDETTVADAVWEYGCDSVGRGRTWRWYRVRDTGEACEDRVPWMGLDGGEHSFRILHREEVSFRPIDFNFGGIAALVVTNDPSYDPVDDYDPNP